MLAVFDRRPQSALGSRILVAACLFAVTLGNGMLVAPVSSFAEEPVATVEPSELAGHHCLVCQKAVSAAGVHELFRGRSVVRCGAEGCEHAWETDRESYFSKLQPKGALFQERSGPNASAPKPVSPGMAWIGWLSLTAILSGAGAAYIAVNRARAPLGWFAFGLVGNLPALVITHLSMHRGKSDQPIPTGLAKVSTTRTPIACPECRRTNHPSAVRCLGCGTTLRPRVASEVAAAQNQ